jgi:Bacterial regulatory helix-turn-helix protein, lysR family
MSTSDPVKLVLGGRISNERCIEAHAARLRRVHHQTPTDVRQRSTYMAGLMAFVNVAEQHSFRAAASRLGVTPSAISHAMRQLEVQLGVRLVDRTTRRVSLTDAGVRLFDQLRPAFGQIDRALEELKRSSGR